jgi:hypothetical protein
MIPLPQLLQVYFFPSGKGRDAMRRSARVRDCGGNKLSRMSRIANLPDLHGQDGGYGHS